MPSSWFGKKLESWVLLEGTLVGTLLVRVLGHSGLKKAFTSSAKYKNSENEVVFGFEKDKSLRVQIFSFRVQPTPPKTKVLDQDFFKIMQFSGNFKGKHLFWANFGLRAPLTGSPPALSGGLSHLMLCCGQSVVKWWWPDDWKARRGCLGLLIHLANGDQDWMMLIPEGSFCLQTKTREIQWHWAFGRFGPEAPSTRDATPRSKANGMRKSHLSNSNAWVHQNGTWLYL